MKTQLLSLAALGMIAGPASATLMVDFNSTTQDGPANNEAGYQPYDAAHEVPGSFGLRNYNVNFTHTGAAVVGLTPAWPNTTDARVQQAIDRSAFFDSQWVGNNINLLTDWLGVDTRTGNGGNGDYDGISGTPTYLTLTLGGLPAADYDWLSFHHDTEHMNTEFNIEVSTDGGATYALAHSGQMTDGPAGGNPPSAQIETGTPDPDPHNLPSTANFGFSADGTNDVVLRFTPLSQVAVHQQLFGINGFELAQTAASMPDGGTTLGLLGFAVLFLRGLRRTKA